MEVLGACCRNISREGELLMEKTRSSFTGKLGFVLAAAGSAVGLGNLWRFPYLAAQYGGGIFLLVYLVLVVTFGFALMAGEIAPGPQNGPERRGRVPDAQQKMEVPGLSHIDCAHDHFAVLLRDRRLGDQILLRVPHGADGSGGGRLLLRQFCRRCVRADRLALRLSGHHGRDCLSRRGEGCGEGQPPDDAGARRAHAVRHGVRACAARRARGRALLHHA